MFRVRPLACLLSNAARRNLGLGALKKTEVHVSYVVFSRFSYYPYISQSSVIKPNKEIPNKVLKSAVEGSLGVPVPGHAKVLKSAVEGSLGVPVPGHAKVLKSAVERCFCKVTINKGSVVRIISRG